MIYGYIRTSRAAGQHRLRRGSLRLRPGQRPPRVDWGGVAWCRNRQTGDGKPEAKPDRRRPRCVAMCYHQEEDPQPIGLDAVQGLEMTNARLARVPRPDIDYAGLSFNPDDPEPLPEAMYQYPILEEILPILGAHLNRLHSREEAFRSSNTFICYNPNNLNVRVGPDFYFASGVDAPAIEGTKLYLPWEVGKPRTSCWKSPRRAPRRTM